MPKEWEGCGGGGVCEAVGSRAPNLTAWPVLPFGELAGPGIGGVKR